MDIKDFTVGQTAYYSGGHIRSKGEDPLIEVTVTKVGRKYVTVKSGWRERRFEPPFRNQVEKYLIEKTGIGTAGRLYKTLKAYEEQRELESLRVWLRKAADWPEMGKYTLEQLRETKAILER